MANMQKERYILCTVLHKNNLFPGGRIMKKLSLIAVALILSLNTYGYDDNYYFDDAIDVDGLYTDGNSNMSPSDRMKKQREMLEQRNEQMVRRRIENMRVRQEMEMMKKLQQAMNQSFKQIDEALR
jgi:hypothetical protein